MEKIVIGHGVPPHESAANRPYHGSSAAVPRRAWPNGHGRRGMNRQMADAACSRAEVPRDRLQKIAVVRRNGLGDLLLTYPMLFAIKKKYPDSSLTLFVSSHNAQLLPFLPKIADRIVTFPSSGNKYFTVLKTAWRYRGFDIGFSAKTSPMKLMNFFLFTLRAKERIAYVKKGSLSSFLINKKCFYESDLRHQATKALALVDQENDIPESYYPQISIPSENVSLSFPSSPLYLLLSASTTNDCNRIHPQKYAGLVNTLGQRLSFFTILMGEKKDVQRAQAISQRLTLPHQCIFPRNFNEFMVLQSQCDVFFVPDGGVAHIGAGLQKKLVVLFGNKGGDRWRPLSKEAVILSHPQHVDSISNEEILEALYLKCFEVKSGRVSM